MDPIFSILNASKVFNGATTILMNLGARHVMRDIPDSFDDFLKIFGYVVSLFSALHSWQHVTLRSQYF